MIGRGRPSGKTPASGPDARIGEVETRLQKRRDAVLAGSIVLGIAGAVASWIAIVDAMAVAFFSTGWLRLHLFERHPVITWREHVATWATLGGSAVLAVIIGCLVARTAFRRGMKAMR